PSGDALPKRQRTEPLPHWSVRPAGTKNACKVREPIWIVVDGGGGRGKTVEDGGGEGTTGKGGEVVPVSNSLIRNDLNGHDGPNRRRLRADIFTILHEGNCIAGSKDNGSRQRQAGVARLRTCDALGSDHTLTRDLKVDHGCIAIVSIGGKIDNKLIHALH